MSGERIAAHPAGHPRAYLSILDVLRPDAAGVLRSACGGLTVEEMSAREGGALRVMTWGDWRAEAAAQQRQVPARWVGTTHAAYRHGLEVLPPVAWAAGSFCVGEPVDHDFATGMPRFHAYRESPNGGEHYATSRPVTVAELDANRATAPGVAWSC